MSGQAPVSPGRASLALLLPVRTRNPALGIAAPVVAGFTMQLLGSVSGLDLTRKLLLTTPFESWHGLFAQHPFTGPLTTGLAAPPSSTGRHGECFGGQPARVLIGQRHRPAAQPGAGRGEPLAGVV
jgi:hypothetical protein